MEEAFKYVRNQQSSPFFLYLALTLPHANNEGLRLTGNGAEIPHYGIYAEEDWPDGDKGQAAMITRMDSDVAAVVDFAKERNIDDKTRFFSPAIMARMMRLVMNIERFSHPVRCGESSEHYTKEGFGSGDCSDARHDPSGQGNRSSLLCGRLPRYRCRLCRVFRYPTIWTASA